MTGGGRRLLERRRGVLGTDLAACGYEDGLDAAAKVRCAALVLAGESTAWRPPARGPGSPRRSRAPGSSPCRPPGHMLMVEQPDATLDALVEFVRLAAGPGRAG